MFLTVFTPTYNRADKLHRLYKSLENQSYRDFEWLVVDDGSNDNTGEVIEEYSTRSTFPIRYFRKENGGKHTAINKGAREAAGDLFFILDSDDYLPDNSIEILHEHYLAIKDRKDFCGICGLKSFPDNSVIGGNTNYDILECSLFEYRYKYKIKGDKAETFYTNLFRENLFPEIAGEKYCSECLVYNRISHNKKIRFFNSTVQYCEYLEDGLSAQIIKIRQQSPGLTQMVYKEGADYPIPFIERYKNMINYWRFGFYSAEPFYIKAKRLGILKTVISLPFGFLFYMKDKLK